VSVNASGVVRTAELLLGVINPPAELYPINITGTGGATGALIAEDVPDPNYILVSAPAGAYQGPNAYGIGNNSMTISQGLPAGWPENDAQKWIGPLPTATISSSPAGKYTYQTTFDLTGRNPASAFIDGAYYAADQCEIFLNGKSVALSSNPQLSSQASFILTTGFQAGVNTLQFVVTNTTTGATGLQVFIPMTGVGLP
jgi:hypothetical protein